MCPRDSSSVGVAHRNARLRSRSSMPIGRQISCDISFRGEHGLQFSATQVAVMSRALTPASQANRLSTQARVRCSAPSAGPAGRRSTGFRPGRVATSAAGLGILENGRRSLLRSSGFPSRFGLGQSRGLRMAAIWGEWAAPSCSVKPIICDWLSGWRSRRQRPNAKRFPLGGFFNRGSGPLREGPRAAGGVKRRLCAGAVIPGKLQDRWSLTHPGPHCTRLQQFALRAISRG